MPESGVPFDAIQVGDRVAYTFTTREVAHYALGKVIGIFSIRDGQTLADVEWDDLGPPKRLNVTNLTKA
jgi:hypothetical protein